MTKSDGKKLGTDELLRILAQSPTPAPRIALWFACLLLVLASVLCTLAVLGLRHDAALPQSWTGMAAKTLFLVVCAAMSAVCLRTQAVPLPCGRPFAMLYALAGLLAVLAAAEWLLRPAADILAGFAPRNFITCLLSVSLYGIAGLAVLTCVLRDYAPASSRDAAALAAVAAATAGAVGYSLHCRVDSPTFVLVAYGLPVLALALAARAFVPRYLRW